MTGVLQERGHLDTEGRWRENPGRRQPSTRQGEGLSQIPPSQPSDGSGPADALTSDLQPLQL